MSIAEGYATVKKALFGDCKPFANCDRCKRPLVLSSCTDGNCQPNNVFKFGFKTSPQSIFHGMIGEALGWEARLCDPCLMGLRHWLKGQKLGPWGENIGCNQSCDGTWQPMSIELDGTYKTKCDKCGYVVNRVAG